MVYHVAWLEFGGEGQTGQQIFGHFEVGAIAFGTEDQVRFGFVGVPLEQVGQHALLLSIQVLSNAAAQHPMTSSEIPIDDRFQFAVF